MEKKITVIDYLIFFFAFFFLLLQLKFFQKTPLKLKKIANIVYVIICQHFTTSLTLKIEVLVSQ